MIMTLIENDTEATDPTYQILQNIKAGEDKWVARQHVEELYSATKDVLDKNFREYIKRQFHPRYAEMYFAAVLKDKCGLKISHPSDTGPDLFLNDINGWAEVVSVGDGDEDNQNSVEKLRVGHAQKHSENKILIRFTGVFCKKSEAIKHYISDGIIGESQPTIICISGGAMTEGPPFSTPVGGVPHIVKVFFSLDAGCLQIKPQEREKSIMYGHSEGATKKTESGDTKIKTDYFLTEEHSHISAVLYAYTSAGCPLQKNEWGSDFIKIYNPNAKNPLPRDFIKCGEGYARRFTDDGFDIQRC